MTAYVPGNPAAVTGSNGPPATMFGEYINGVNSPPIAGSALYFRSIGSGPVSQIMTQVTTSSGNIGVGIYAGVVTIQTNYTVITPQNLLASSGVIPCPAAGVVTIPISPAPVNVNENSYFYVYFSSITAAIFSFGSGWSGGYAPITMINAGMSYNDGTTAPLPAIAGNGNLGNLGGTRGSVLMLQGA